MLALDLAKFCSDFPFNGLVIVLVGLDEYRFDVHKDILCQASAFFKAALRGNFIESHGTVRVPEQEVTTFKCFIRWVYTRRLGGFYYTDTMSPSRSQMDLDVKDRVKELQLEPDDLPWDDPFRKRRDLANYHDLPLLLLVKLYILADVLQVPGLQDHVITAMDYIYYPKDTGAYWQQDIDLRPAGLEKPVESINLAWSMSPDRSNLRRLMLAMVCDSTKDISEPPFDDTLDPGFIKQAFKKLAKLYNDSCSMVSTRGKWSICQYHEHDAGCPQHVDFPIYGA